MLAFGLVFAPRDHVFTVVPHFDYSISILENLRAIESYDRIFVGQDLPTDWSADEATISYLCKGKKSLATARGGRSYAESLNAAFPDPSSLPGWTSRQVLFNTHRPQRTNQGNRVVTE